MFEIVFYPIIAIAFNAHICAANPADVHSVLYAMKPGVCLERKEIYKFNP